MRGDRSDERGGDEGETDRSGAEGSGRRARLDIADYMLVYRNQKLAVTEAKNGAILTGT